MSVAVVVHVDADRPYVDSLRLTLETRLVACVAQPKTPIMAFDERLPLILVWSQSAAAAQFAQGFAAMARAHGGDTIVCACDETAIPSQLERAATSVVNGSPRSSFFPGGLNAALVESQRRQLSAMALSDRADPTAAVASRRAFTEGVARGLAGSVAVFGVGGAAALGMESFNEVNLYAPEVAPIEASAPLFQEEAIAFAEAEALQQRAEADVIYIDPALRNVPLAQPGPEEVARFRAASFVTDTPLETYQTASAPIAGMSDAEIVAALNRVESMRISASMEVIAFEPAASPVMSVSDVLGPPAGEAASPTI